jgi:hypothetical protein
MMATTLAIRLAGNGVIVGKIVGIHSINGVYFLETIINHIGNIEHIQ